jgi:transposase-like protein
MTNRYLVRARISEHVFRRLLRHVAADLTAVQIAQLTGLNRNTVNRLLMLLRHRMAEACEADSPFSGEVEVDESYFGPKRVKGKRGRGAGKKTIVFGIFKRGGKVYTELVPDCSKATLCKAIRGKVSLDTIVHSDGWRGYDGLVDLGYAKHLRVNHDADQFADASMPGNHINGIESFWGYAKTRLTRYRGLHPDTFLFHLKECEFRFNHRGQDLYRVLLTLCRRRPLS